MSPIILNPDGRPVRREERPQEREGKLPIDADRVAERLYQGAEPPLGPTLKNLDFDVVVFAAEENQPASWAVPGLIALYCPLYDNNYVPVREATPIALKVADLWQRGARILVTCHMGWNRSGLITALAWRYITGRSGAEAIRLIKHARGDNALSNRHFHDYVASLGPMKTR